MRLEWNAPGERYFEAGLDRGVLYPAFAEGSLGIPWNGLISVSEDPSGGDVEPVYYDGIKRADVVSSEDFQATLTAFAAPPDFARCEGRMQLAPGLTVGNQYRELFHLSYRTMVGNDLVGTELGYKLHLVWNCTAAPSANTYKTVAADALPETRSWTIHTVPPDYLPYRPTAQMVIDSTQVRSDIMAELEALIYGDDEFDAGLPHPTHIMAILAGGIAVE